MSDYNGVTEQAKVAGHRLADAKALLLQQRWRAAMYMAGYAVECRLKARLMRKHGCYHLDDLGAEFVKQGRLVKADEVYTHSLTLLLNWTDRKAVLQANRDLWKLFSTVSRWSSEWRYSVDPAGDDPAHDFVEAADQLVTWFDNNI